MFFFIGEWYFTVCMNHNFLIHSFDNGLLVCFHILAIVNRAAVNTGSTCDSQFWFPQCVCPAVGLLAGSHGSSLSSFLRNLHTLLHSGCTSLHSYQWCKNFFSAPSPAFIVCRPFDSSHSDWCEMIPHCGFDLHFSDKEWCWASFHVVVSHLYVFFGEMSVCSLAHFSIGSFIFLELSCMSCLYIFEINSL